mmetsp:Transcript_3427/g.8260  ORF Transcript_3427/g.8260 Transcript_3427/m.8260 type:complete len:161 (-) Transcript_3427:894-1376(-)
MELFTGKLLFDNRSVQALLASHISLVGPLPPSLIRAGQLSDHFFASETEQTPVGKHEGRLCRFRPHKSSIAVLLAQHDCKDAELASFIGILMQPDPERRASATEALRHPFLEPKGPPKPYQLDKVSGHSGFGVPLVHSSPTSIPASVAAAGDRRHTCRDD